MAISVFREKKVVIRLSYCAILKCFNIVLYMVRA